MLDTELRSLARGFRARVKEILFRVETMHDAEAQVKMREIAAGYERLAQRVEPRDPPQGRDVGRIGIAATDRRKFRQAQFTGNIRSAWTDENHCRESAAGIPNSRPRPASMR